MAGEMRCFVVGAKHQSRGNMRESERDLLITAIGVMVGVSKGTQEL